MKRSIIEPRLRADAGHHEIHPSRVGLGEAATPRDIPRPSLFADAHRIAILARLEGLIRDGSTLWARPALSGTIGS